MVGLLLLEEVGPYEPKFPAVIFQCKNKSIYGFEYLEEERSYCLFELGGTSTQGYNAGQIRSSSEGCSCVIKTRYNRRQIDSLVDSGVYYLADRGVRDFIEELKEYVQDYEY